MASGLFGFLQSYGQNTLTMFGSGALGAGVGIGASSGAAPGADAIPEATGGATATASSAGEGSAPSTQSTSTAGGGDTQGDATNAAENVQNTTTRGGRRNRTVHGPPRMYPRSMLLFVALIAFLLGSLLRSLLSPADFIYVVTDARDNDANGVAAAATTVACTTAGTCMTTPGAARRISKAAELAQNAGVGMDGSGWREIRRLLEIKYLVGGWDFQVAVVRRH